MIRSENIPGLQHLKLKLFADKKPSEGSVSHSKISWTKKWGYWINWSWGGTWYDSGSREYVVGWCWLTWSHTQPAEWPSALPPAWSFSSCKLICLCIHLYHFPRASFPKRINAIPLHNFSVQKGAWSRLKVLWRQSTSSPYLHRESWPIFRLC